MKDRRYANRGGAFETFIKYANQRYQHEGLAFIQKQCTEFIPLRDGSGRVYNVKVEHQATFDFLGRYKSYPIAIEAKNTNTGSLRFDAVQPNQYADMNAFCREAGTIGLLLISFDLERFYAVPWAFWSVAYDLRVRRNDKDTAINIHAHGQEWAVPKKYSIRAEDLLPEWEVPGRDHGYGLHYLKNAEKYICRSDTQNE